LKVAAASVDAYIARCSPEARSALVSLREVARRTLPQAEETISYGMPAYRLDGSDVVYFAGWRRHVSLYPVPAADEGLAREIQPYRAGKATLRFPLDEPLPTDLIERVIRLLAARHRPA
jgi:uncharacterized protein YdhG (YjbR/CyaY superfamily)